MMVKSNVVSILRELEQAANLLSEKELTEAMLLLAEASQVFVAGAGRSGLMGRSFAMRLAHLGVPTFVVGETTTPPIRKGDVLVLCTGSGETKSLLSMAQKAKSLGASVVVLTIHKQSSIGQLADVAIQIHAAAKEDEGERKSIQPMGSLFEQSLIITLDGIILSLMKKMNQDTGAMFQRHANLE
ncbi:6-phospho-3-hexuloisomerase [Paenibacillus sp. Marseille-Q4541]|uniref:6-phospho-3-hexuloisomerase n=1 Tax=Paenibacillus sp. Marseille-Q4541 TaxID=2831522 RepID=UPI001BA86D11|nr:6-phospho-3-hexuloisomerase [Paenibacillus sp. Marseille-Q4541]